MQAFNSEKFDTLVHHICAKSDTEKLGAIKLNKILWFSDIVHFLTKGESITGATYIKRQFGPVPQPIVGALERLKAANKLCVAEKVHYGLPKREFITLCEPDLSVFQGEEISLVDDILETITNQHTANSISDATHDEIWEMAEIGETIPYQAVMVSQLGEIDENDFTWAKNIIADTYKEAA